MSKLWRMNNNMNNSILFIIGPSNYGMSSDRIRLIGSKIKEKRSSIEVKYLFISDNKCREKVENHLKKGGMVFADNGYMLGIKNAKNESIFKEYGKQIAAFFDKNSTFCVFCYKVW